jgi:hypothetical protein
MRGIKQLSGLSHECRCENLIEHSDHSRIDKSVIVGDVLLVNALHVLSQRLQITFLAYKKYFGPGIEHFRNRNRDQAAH